MRCCALARSAFSDSCVTRSALWVSHQLAAGWTNVTSLHGSQSVWRMLTLHVGRLADPSDLKRVSWRAMCRSARSLFVSSVVAAVTG